MLRGYKCTCSRLRSAVPNVKNHTLWKISFKKHTYEYATLSKAPFKKQEKHVNTLISNVLPRITMLFVDYGKLTKQKQFSLYRCFTSLCYMTFNVEI